LKNEAFLGGLKRIQERADELQRRNAENAENAERAATTVDAHATAS
jgi:hypothetical protein